MSEPKDCLPELVESESLDAPKAPDPPVKNKRGDASRMPPPVPGARTGKGRVARRQVDAIVTRAWRKGDTIHITEETRIAVEVMAGAGISTAGIAAVMRMEVEHLEWLFEAELERGPHAANANVGMALYQNAMAGSVVAQIFWMKARAGWSETIVHQHDYRRDVKKLTHDELSKIAAGGKSQARKALEEDKNRRPRDGKPAQKRRRAPVRGGSSGGAPDTNEST